MNAKQAVLDHYYSEESLAALLNREFGEGVNWAWKCPSHTSTMGKLKVGVWLTNEGARWRCWSCNAGFNAIDAVIQARGVSFKEALTVLAEETGTLLTVQPRPSYDALTETPGHTLERLRAYASVSSERLLSNRKRLDTLLEERGWSEGTVRALGIGLHVDKGVGVSVSYLSAHEDKETHPIRGTQRIRQGLLRLWWKLRREELSERELKVVKSVLNYSCPRSIHENFLFSWVCGFSMEDMNLLTHDELRHWNAYLTDTTRRTRLLTDEEGRVLREVITGKRRTVSAPGFNLRERHPESFNNEPKPIEAYTQWALSYEERRGDAWVLPVYNRRGHLMNLQLRRCSPGGQKYLNTSKRTVAPCSASYYLRSDSPDAVFITEGIPDAITVYDDGESAVGLLGANAMRGTRGAENAQALVDEFPNAEFIVVGDRDITGYKAAHEMEELIAERGGTVSVFIPPPIPSVENPDITDYIKYRKSLPQVVP